MMTKGALFDILPAYNSETGESDIFDEIARCQGEFIRDAGNDVLAYVGHDEVFVPRARIRQTMPL